MPLTFDAIPVDLRVPGAAIEIVNTGALRGLPGMPVRILVMGQRLATGTVGAGEPVRVLSEDAAQKYFGRGSMMHLMFRALKLNNNWTESWAIALDDDPAAQAATGSILLEGAPAVAGTLNLWIAGQRLRVGVAATHTPAMIAASVAAAITARTDLPVTATINDDEAAQVDLAARNRGEAANHIDIRVNHYQDEATPAGLTATITPMSGGSGNPDMDPAITAMADEWFTDIIMPWNDAAGLTAIEDKQAASFGPLVMQDGTVYFAASGTHAELVTLGESRNTQHTSPMGFKNGLTPPWEVAAALGGLVAYHSKIDPARPLQTLEIKGVLAPAIADRFTLEERNLLLFAGMSTWRVDDGGRVLVERIITSYQTNAQGVEDPGYLDITTLKTLAYMRYSVRARILSKFPRFKLASDGTRFGAGQKVVTPKIIRAELIALFRQWEDAGLAENIDQFKADLVVERDPDDANRINALIPPDIINQFRVFAGQIEFRL